MKRKCFSKFLTDAAYAFTLRPYIAWHHHRTHKYGATVREKYGEVPARAGEKPCLLLHAVSVGEAVAVRTVIDEFSRRHPDWEVRVSVSTATGRQVAIDKYGAERVCFFPLDLSAWVRRFFDRVRPTAILLMELEVWPNFMREAQARGIPVLVANARITEKSAAQYGKAAGLPLIGRMVRNMLNRPALWLAQTQEYVERLRALGVEDTRLRLTGNVKYDTVPTNLDPELRARYRRLLGVDEAAPVLVAGSTHPGEPDEEATVLAAFAELRAGFPTAKLVVVPRHPHRIDAVEAQTKAQFSCVRRSKLSAENPAGDDQPVVLVDTMGELASLYAAADAVFIGGTFINHGGQNMLEPCGLERPTVIGPSVHNFSEAVDVLRAADGITCIGGRAELLPALREIFQNPQEAGRRARRGREALIARQGASARIIDALEEVLAWR